MKRKKERGKEHEASHEINGQDEARAFFTTFFLFSTPFPSILAILWLHSCIASEPQHFLYPESFISLERVQEVVVSRWKQK